MSEIRTKSVADLIKERNKARRERDAAVAHAGAVEQWLERLERSRGMSIYAYVDPDGWSFEIKREFNGDGVTVLTTDERRVGVAVNLPTDEREKAAQALAGDDYLVIPAPKEAP